MDDLENRKLSFLPLRHPARSLVTTSTALPRLTKNYVRHKTNSPPILPLGMEPHLGGPI
jgi:hypothetical protein